MASERRVPAPPGNAQGGKGAGAYRGRRAEMEALDAVGQSLSSSLELHSSLVHGLLALLEAWPCHAAGLLLPSWASQELEVHTAWRAGQQVETGFRRIDLLAPTARLAVAWAPPRLVADGAVQVAPLRAGQQALGLLAIVAPAGTRELRQPFLEALGQRFAQAVANARLYEDVRAEADRLAAISAVGDAARRPLPVGRLLSQALRQVLAVTDLELAAVYLRDAESGATSVAAHAGMSHRLAARLVARLPTRARTSATLPLVEEDLAGAGSGARTPLCLMHISLRSPRRDLGFLTVGSYSRPHFAPGATRLLMAVANQIALGLDYALLFREAKERAAELVRANEAMNAALHSKDQFLANVTHELRRPLAPARMVLETLLEAPEGHLSPQRKERLLRNALNNLDSLNGLISELLDAARMEKTAEPPGREIVDLGALVRQAIASIRPLAEESKLRLQAIVPAAPVRVYGDAQGLGRVVGNLLSNAVKFNKRRGSVLVQLERSGNQAVLSVTDTGIGIPVHAQPHIFERFYQADGSSTRTHEGVGLGLYIAREIVEQHGGQIRFDTQEGVGTTFTVTLPLA